MGARLRLLVSASVLCLLPMALAWAEVRDEAERLVVRSGRTTLVLDKQAKTLYPWRNFEFADGTHYRNVIVDAAGRIVRPFNTAHSLDVSEAVERITALAKELLLEARARTRPASSDDE